MNINVITVAFYLIAFNLSAQKTTPTIKDESKVPAYDLPELLISDQGKKIKTKTRWERYRRPEILEHFASQVYGKLPGVLTFHKAEVLEDETSALVGKATRKQVMLHFKKGDMSESRR